MRSSFQSEKNIQGIRPVVCAFILFEIFMLYQTSFNNRGTIVSGAVCGLILLTYLLETKTIKINTSNALLICYVIELMLSSIVYSGFNSKLSQFVIYTIIFILLSPMVLIEKEEKLLISGYVLTGIVYSAMIILYRMNNPLVYIHSRLVIFGSELDPNYIGLPLVVTFSILFYDVLTKKKQLLKLVALFAAAVGIILTSSRGNFLSLSLCVIGNIILFLRFQKMRWYKKVIILEAI